MTKDCKETFCDIYRRKVWGDGSGGGSAPDVAKPYIDFVSDYIKRCPVRKLAWEIKWILDIGSGDGVVAGMIDIGNWNMVLIDAATGGDALTDTLPAADLVLCKEVLQHLSNEQVQLLLDRTAHCPVRLFTNNCDTERMNEDIDTGDFRPVDLTLPPFNQPAKTIFKYGCWHVQELRR